MKSMGQVPGVRGSAMALLLGVLLVQWLTVLPPSWLVLLVALAMTATFWRWSRLRAPALVVLGCCWGAWCGGRAMDARLPSAFEGRDFSVIGRISGLPQIDKTGGSFLFDIAQSKRDGATLPLHGLARISWIGATPALLPCAQWKLSLRLRRPRGMINPGGADTERSALQRGIVAVGYVRNDASNAFMSAPSWCLDRLRDRLASGIAHAVPDAHDAALLRAFTVGDTRALSQMDWDVARANGVSHLIAISGFHVGVAAMFGVGFVILLYAAFPSLGLRWPHPQAQSTAAFLVALAYSALAGFGLPTVRTLLMIAAVVLARCGRRYNTAGHALALALMAILVFDPLSVLSAGFWLSFVGVTWLLLCLEAKGRGWRAFLRELSLGQIVMTVGLLPITLWFFGEASLIGIVSNLIAVPFVSFVVVPVALCGLLCLLLYAPLAMPALWLAAKLAHAQWWLLVWTSTWPGAHVYLPAVHAWALGLAMFGAFWLLMPRGTPVRWLGLFLFLPLIWPPRDVPAYGGFQVWMLDVGQGLAMIVHTREHTMVYDAGARFPSGFDLGEAVVVPSLHALGIRDIDVLMISHGDNDHAGGAAAVAKAFPGALRYAGEPERMSLPMTACKAGDAWQWDGVRFRVLYPGTTNAMSSKNDRSCVVSVEGISGQLWLTGDIASDVEMKVAEGQRSRSPGVLQVPHHGSKTSSSVDFIRAVDPVIALVSAGWRNRFGHPRPEVLKRYADADVPVLNTAIDGAIQVDFPASGKPSLVARWRLRDARYWRE